MADERAAAVVAIGIDGWHQERHRQPLVVAGGCDAPQCHDDDLDTLDAADVQAPLDPTDTRPRAGPLPPRPYERPPVHRWFPNAGIDVRRIAGASSAYALVNLETCGGVKPFNAETGRQVLGDCGIIGRLVGGQMVTCQWIDPRYKMSASNDELTVTGALHRVRLLPLTAFAPWPPVSPEPHAIGSDVRPAARRPRMSVSPVRSETASARSGTSGAHAAPTVTIIVPAYNEAAAIERVLASVRHMQRSLGYPSELLVVDDGSVDETGTIAARAGARVLTHPYNRGKGAALKTGIRAARGQTIVVIDGDGQHDPADVPRLLAHQPAYAMVMGDRGRGGGASPLWRTPGKALLGLIANALVGRRIPDLNCGLRAVNRQLVLRLLPILPNGFSFETTLTIAVLKSGDAVTWVPIRVWPRTGVSTVRAFDGLNTLMLILRLIALFAPLRVFLPISIITFFVGLWYMAESYLLYQEASIKALLALIGAALFFLFGLLADQVAALRRGEAAYRRDEEMEATAMAPMARVVPDVDPASGDVPAGDDEAACAGSSAKRAATEGSGGSEG
jgi:glycosyltransferase involved in cell wall biosynthesis